MEDNKQKIIEKLKNEDWVTAQDKYENPDEFAKMILDEYENWLKSPEGREYLKSLIGEEKQEEKQEERREEREQKEEPREIQEQKTEINVDKLKEEVLKEIEAKEIIEQDLRELREKYQDLLGEKYSAFEQMVILRANDVLQQTGNYYKLSDVAEELLDILKPIVEKTIGKKIEELSQQGSPPSGEAGVRSPGVRTSLEELRKSLGLPPEVPWKKK